MDPLQVAPALPVLSPPKSLLPDSVRQKIENAFDMGAAEWAEIELYFETRIAELMPVCDSHFVAALEIAYCDKELVEHTAHSGRMLVLGEQMAIRDVLKPGYAQKALGGRTNGNAEPGDDEVCLEGKTYKLNDYNNPQLEAALKAAAVQKLARLGLTSRALKTKAMELQHDQLDKIQRRMALVQARRELLLTSYARDAARVVALVHAAG